MVCEEEALVQKISDLYEKISSLESLKPCKNVDMLFTELVTTCIPPMPIVSNDQSSFFDINKLSKSIQETRSKLIKLCGEAEGHLENHYSDILNSFENPLDHLNLFPYYSNYIKLTHLEFKILTQHFHNDLNNSPPNKIAFLGSGPLPLTSIVLATNHLKDTTFHNYDFDPVANSKALNLISVHPDLSKRMFFHTNDVFDVSDELREYEVVFLAALVGMEKEEKVRVIEHLAKYMARGAYLMVRSAHGARAFLYPVVEPCDLVGFQILSFYHPTDEVINSVIIARKRFDDQFSSIDNNSNDQRQQQQQQQHHQPILLMNKCSESIQVQVLNNNNNNSNGLMINHGNIMIEEFGMELEETVT